MRLKTSHFTKDVVAHRLWLYSASQFVYVLEINVYLSVVVVVLSKTAPQPAVATVTMTKNSQQCKNPTRVDEAEWGNTELPKWKALQLWSCYGTGSHLTGQESIDRLLPTHLFLSLVPEDMWGRDSLTGAVDRQAVTCPSVSLLPEGIFWDE